MKKKYIQYLVFIILMCAAFYLLPEKIASILNNRGFMAYTENDYRLAIGLFKKSVRIYPKAKIYFNLGCAYEKTGNNEQAISEFKKAIKKDPEYAPGYQALANIYSASGDYEQAEDYLNKLKSLGAQDAGKRLRNIKHDRIAALYNQGVRFYNLNQEEKALDSFKEVIALDTSNHLAYKAGADIYFKQGKLKDALHYYKKAVALGLKDADAFNSMGIIYMRIEDYDTAITYFNKACKIDADNLNYMYNLASTLRDSGQFEKALSLYNKVAAREFSYPGVHNDIAGIYDSMGSHNKARMEYKKGHDIAAHLVETLTEDDFTLTRLAVSCNGLNRTAQAEKILNEVIARNPKYYNAYYARGQVYRNMGKGTQSEADFQKARELLRNTFPHSDEKPELVEKSARKMPEKISLEEDTDNSFCENAAIYLLNGHVVRGRIKQKTDKNITLEIKTGRAISTITFSASKIKEIKRIKEKD